MSTEQPLNSISGAEVENKARSVKHRVEENSKTLDKLVDGLVAKYNTELEAFIDECKGLIVQKDALDDWEVERMVLRIPLFLYYAVGGLETLGIEGDTAKAVRNEAYSEVYMIAKGTIPERESTAELGTLVESMVEVAYSRAYKKLKAKVEMADKLGQAAKKLLDKRITELNVHGRESSLIKGRFEKDEQPTKRGGRQPEQF